MWSSVHRMEHKCCPVKGYTNMTHGIYNVKTFHVHLITLTNNDASFPHPLALKSHLAFTSLCSTSTSELQLYLGNLCDNNRVTTYGTDCSRTVVPARAGSPREGTRQAHSAPPDPTQHSTARTRNYLWTHPAATSPVWRERLQPSIMRSKAGRPSCFLSPKIIGATPELLRGEKNEI